MMRTSFHPGTLDLLALSYEPVATIPGLVVARYRTRADRGSRHWTSLSPRSMHRCGPAGALSERTEFLAMTAISKAGYWCHIGRWRAPNISIPVAAHELCEHSALPRLLARGISTSNVRSRHVTIEVESTPDLPLSAILVTLTRLHDLGVRVSYHQQTSSSDFAEFPFDEMRVALGASVTNLANVPTETGDGPHHPAVLAAGVATGDQLMAALGAGAAFIDGAFAGTVRSDRSIVREPLVASEPFAYL